MLHNRSIDFRALTLGVCYYPEHWDEALWGSDLTRMLEHGIEVVRVFEFAWSCVEKDDGIFDFSLFDRFLDLAHAKGIKVILCTPTATPPSWLSHKYPEVLNADQDGHLYRHGHRRHVNYNSDAYHRLAERFISKLAARYGDHPAVIGWQIDNEINCEIDVFHSESDHEAFRQYLKRHFVTLSALNDAIGARFWNQTYTDWSEIRINPKVPAQYSNPHMALLEKRFISEGARRFVKLQSDLISRHSPGRFITTNGVFGHLDNHEMTQESLDFICYDSYPNFSFDDELHEPGSMNDRASGMSLSLARSISGRFGVMEQQSGAGGWTFKMLQPMPKPGQMRLWTMQSVAHGADFVSFFRWRTCSYGTEIYWYGLNDYSNQPNRRLAELKQIGRDFKALADVAQSRYAAKVGLVFDYLNEWDGETDVLNGKLKRYSYRNLYQAAQAVHTPVDFIYLRKTGSHLTELKELLPYDVLFYPHPSILTEEAAELLTAYCQSGGTLVLGARTGYKDEYGRCPMRPMPGHARELCGAEIEEYTLTRAYEPDIIMDWGDEETPAALYNDILRPVADGETVAIYVNGHYAGRPAVIRKEYPYGGAAFYVGSAFDMKTASKMLADLGIIEPYGEWIDCPGSLEIAVREKDGARYLFVLNYEEGSSKFNVLTPMFDVLSGEMASGSVDIEGFGVCVFQMEV